MPARIHPDRISRRRTLAWLGTLAVGGLLSGGVLGGCGKVVPKGGVPVDANGKPLPPPKVEVATDLIPADLDLVLRLDVGKIRQSLGTEQAAELLDKALEQAPAQGLARRALLSAEVVWLALRGADIESGDRVLVVRAQKESEIPDRLSWAQAKTDRKDLIRHDNRSQPRRDGTAAIFRMGKRDAVFISPVELASVERVLRLGPDADRGQPEARGLLSVDYRAHRLSPGLEARYPSLAKLVRGIDRLNATVTVTGASLRLDGRIRCKSPAEATRVLRFLATVRDGAARRPAYAELLAKLVLEQADTNVNVRWELPQAAIGALLPRPEPPPTAKPPAATKPAPATEPMPATEPAPANAKP